jgi:HEAT repeat protein
MRHSSDDSQFSPSAAAEDLIRALCAVGREDAVRNAPEILTLLGHPVPEVRAEALTAMFVTGRLVQHRSAALRALSRDADEGVRAKAAYAIAATASDETLHDDMPLLLRALRNEHEVPEVRRAAYEALLLIFRHPEFPDSLEEFDPQVNVDWVWVRQLELRYDG